MNQPPLQQKADHPLDRRAALAGLGVLHLAAMSAFACGSEAVNIRIESPAWTSTAEAYESLVLTGWLLGLCASAGLLAAWGAGNLLVRTLAALALSSLSLLVFGLCEYYANLRPTEDPNSLALIWLLLPVLVVVELSAYSALTGYRLAWRQIPLQPRRKWHQFRLWELLLVMFVTAIGLGGWRFLRNNFSLLKWDDLSAFLAGQIFLLSCLCLAVFLTTFSRLPAWLLPIAAFALCSTQTALLMVLFVPPSLWSDIAAAILLTTGTVYLAAASSCLATGLALRWLGYDLCQ